MSKMKINTKLNERIEQAVKDIEGLEKLYNSAIIYKAARRYNDRIYKKSSKKFIKKKCQKQVK